MDKTLNEEVFKDYIERKKKYLEANYLYGEDLNDCGGVMLAATDVFEIMSDMAQEIFGALPEEWNLDSEWGKTVASAHNSCRSTFLENIKKLK